jgi:hypothetical protein
MNVNWIFQLEEETLKAELEDYGLEATEVREDLAVRLWFRSNGSKRRFSRKIMELYARAPR